MLLAIKTKMFPFHVVLATLALSICVRAAEIASAVPNSGSDDGDQYPNRAETGQQQPPTKMALAAPAQDATDRRQQVARNGVLMRLLSQVDKPKNLHNADNKKRVKRKNRPLRHKRAYHPYEAGYQIQWPQFEGLNTWRNSYYPLTRPYYVPIYGYDGRIPLYYPPCTYYHNPGTPVHNPNKPPYVAPTYLPPVTTTAPPNKNETTTMKIDDRFGDNDDDDRPIWDNNGVYYPPRGTTPKSLIVPTRRPASGTTTPPPLVHRDDDTPSDKNQPSVDRENEVATVSPDIPRPQGPSKCVWAIVSCCSTSSKDISYECFDQLGCAGPFWDVSPCDTEYAKAAIQTALNYYNSRF